MLGIIECLKIANPRNNLKLTLFIQAASSASVNIQIIYVDWAGHDFNGCLNEISTIITFMLHVISNASLANTADNL